MALALLLAGIPALAAGYRTQELKRLVKITGVDEGALRPGTNHFSHYTITVDDNMTVRHVGLALFKDEVKEMGNTKVLEFVERYFMQLLHPAPNSSAALMIRSDEITFPKGNWRDIKNVKPETPFSLDYQLMRYTLSWKGKEGELSFSFPGKYQLICGENLTEAEEHMMHDVAQTPCSNPPAVDAKDLQPSSMPDFFIKKGSWYHSETLNSSTFYKKREDGSMVPVVDADFIEESVADIMLCPMAAKAFSLDLTMKGYGYKDRRISVPLCQWIDYCTKEGCNIFCGIESIEQDRVRATVIAVNENLNFNHLLTVEVPILAIERGKGTVKADLHAFIPTHNIVNTKGRYNKKNGKNKKTFFDFL